MLVSIEMAVKIPIFATTTLAHLPFAKDAVTGFACVYGIVQNPTVASVGEGVPNNLLLYCFAATKHLVQDALPP